MKLCTMHTAKISRKKTHDTESQSLSNQLKLQPKEVAASN